MSLLGLSNYDSNEDSPANPVQASPAPVVTPAPELVNPQPLLSIVDYDNEPEERPEAPAVFGISLDDDTVQQAVPRKVGIGVSGVQISVVKKTPPRAVDVADTESAEESNAVNPEEGDYDHPAFVLPDSPNQELDPKLLEKFQGLVEKTQEGYSVNEHIRNAKSFRNPDMLEKLIHFFGVREFGTNYPPALYDPTAIGPDEHYDKLEEARRKWEAQQARKPGEKVAFTSGGTQPGTAQAAGTVRKSKWGETEQAAKRQNQG